jgi:predicted DNA-binding protein with PD1-like motif
MKERIISRTGKTGKIIVSRIKNGSDLLLSLQKIVDNSGIRSAIIISGVGLLGKARIRNCKSLPSDFPITDSNRSFNSFKRPLEILGLSGNVSVSEENTLVHAHLTLSYVDDGKIKVIGGHLIEGCKIFGFAEITLMELTDIEMVKNYDPETKTPQLFA